MYEISIVMNMIKKQAMTIFSSFFIIFSFIFLKFVVGLVNPTYFFDGFNNLKTLKSVQGDGFA